MIFKIMSTLFLSLLMIACSSQNYEKLKVSSSTWIGYSPLFYAKEQGWLAPLNIELLNVVSLSENVYLYEADNSDAFVGTQYEYSLVAQKKHSLMPIMMFDRSYGGDLIMANVSIEELQETNSTIHVYLEMDSINKTLIEYFIAKYKLQNKQISYVNQDQTQTSTLNAHNIQEPTVVVTYIPYNETLKKQGFYELVSTKDGLDIFVVDAMFTTNEKFHEHKEQFLELKKLIDKALVVLHNDPYHYYESVKPYMNNISYEEFKASLHDIIWINEKPSQKLLKRLKEVAFPTRDLI